MRPWQKRAELKSQAAGALLPSQLFFHVESPLLSQPINILPIFPGPSQVYSHMKPSWTHPYLLGSQALFTSLISHEGPSYSAPSFVHVHMASLSFCGVRSVHEALCWTLMLIIANPHSKIHSKYWPHFTDEETD